MCTFTNQKLLHVFSLHHNSYTHTNEPHISSYWSHVEDELQFTINKNCQQHLYIPESLTSSRVHFYETSSPLLRCHFQHIHPQCTSQYFHLPGSNHVSYEVDKQAGHLYKNVTIKQQKQPFKSLKIICIRLLYWY